MFVQSVLVAAALLSSIFAAAGAETLATVPGIARLTAFAGGLDHPWGLVFLPDGRGLVTERPGRLRLVGTDGTLSKPLAGVPEVATGGQAGLFDVALDPAFASNRLVYLSYMERVAGGTQLAVARGRLGAAGLDGVTAIYHENRPAEGAANLGSRLVFARDGTLFVTTGDRFGLRDEAQAPSSPLGKVLRIAADGAIPADNPFVGRKYARPELWSIGHRNPEGAALDPRTGQLWTVEHGARGGDEINHPEAGKNYGWPLVTYGVDYSGAKIGIGTAKAGMEQPVFYWDPSIAPSGLMVYDGNAFPAWKGSLFVGALKFELLSRLTRSGDRITGEERLLTDLGERIRDVRQGPDDLIYLLTDSTRGRILRLEPIRP